MSPVCLQCGAAAPDAAKFCSSCGAAVQNDPGGETGQETPVGVIQPGSEAALYARYTAKDPTLPQATAERFKREDADADREMRRQRRASRLDFGDRKAKKAYEMARAFDDLNSITGSWTQAPDGSEFLMRSDPRTGQRRIWSWERGLLIEEKSIKVLHGRITGLFLDLLKFKGTADWARSSNFRSNVTRAEIDPRRSHLSTTKPEALNGAIAAETPPERGGPVRDLLDERPRRSNPLAAMPQGGRGERSVAVEALVASRLHTNEVSAEGLARIWAYGWILDKDVVDSAVLVSMHSWAEAMMSDSPIQAGDDSSTKRFLYDCVIRGYQLGRLATASEGIPLLYTNSMNDSGRAVARLEAISRAHDPEELTSLLGAPLLALLEHAIEEDRPAPIGVLADDLADGILAQGTLLGASLAIAECEICVGDLEH